MERRPLGRTGLEVTPVCLGCSGLGGMPEIFGYDVPRERAIATVRRMLDGPLNFLDTSAGYAEGESERRIGAAVREHGGLPAGVVLATKVDPDPDTGGYTASDVRRVAEQSLERLGLDRFDLLYLHDPETIGFAASMASRGPVEELIRLRDEGVAAHLGVAGGPVEMLRSFLRTGVFEVVLTHNRFTLVDRSAEPLLDDAVAAGIGVVNGAVFGGGILAKGPDAFGKYAYEDASADVLDRVRGIDAVCRRYDVPLGAAALRFSMREPRITSTVTGLSRPERVDEIVEWATMPIPDELWKELAG